MNSLFKFKISNFLHVWSARLLTQATSGSPSASALIWLNHALRIKHKHPNQ